MPVEPAAEPLFDLWYHAGLRWRRHNRLPRSVRQVRWEAAYLYVLYGHAACPNVRLAEPRA